MSQPNIPAVLGEHYMGVLYKLSDRMVVSIHIVLLSTADLIQQQLIYRHTLLGIREKNGSGYQKTHSTSHENYQIFLIVQH